MLTFATVLIVFVYDKVLYTIWCRAVNPRLNFPSHVYDVTESMPSPSFSRPGFEFKYSFLLQVRFIFSLALFYSINLPLRSPLHSSISDQQRRQPIENLVSRSAEGVEDSSVCGASKRSQAVRGDGVGCDALLCLRTCGRS